MKYKILVSGNNLALIIDFIQHMETAFKTLSTTACLQDVIGHFELFQPDAYICFVDSEYSSVGEQISSLKCDKAYNGASIFLVCDAVIYNKLVSNPMLKAEVDMVIRRPITNDNLILRINHYFDNLRAAEEKVRVEEKAKTEEVPAKEEETPAKEKEKAAATAERKSERKHILVVDDDRIILKMLKTALSEKYDVTTMVNGIMAEKFLEMREVDLVILDYEMPGETGADVFRKIKSNPRIPQTPVCFLTGITDRKKIMEVMALKPHGYLLKPIDIDMLLATVSNLTD